MHQRGDISGDGGHVDCIGTNGNDHSIHMQLTDLYCVHSIIHSAPLVTYFKSNSLQLVVSSYCQGKVTKFTVKHYITLFTCV